MAIARAEAAMSSRFRCLLPLLAAAGLQLAGCSARTGVVPPQASVDIAKVRARAAQRVDLPGASAVAEPGDALALAAGTRTQPATPEILRFPDGTVGIRVAQQYYHTIVACRLPDGSFTTRCPAGREPRP
jgi:hypothetical protein